MEKLEDDNLYLLDNGEGKLVGTSMSEAVKEFVKARKESSEEGDVKIWRLEVPGDDHSKWRAGPIPWKDLALQLLDE